MRRALAILAALSCLALPVVLAVLAIDRAPTVAEAPPATPESAGAIRALASQVRARTDALAPGETAEIAVTEAQMAGILAFGGRVLPGLRGAAEAAGGTLTLRLSAPVPGGIGWLNAEIAMPSHAGAPALSRVRLGALDLPPGLTLRTATVLADWVLGGEAGRRLMASVPALDVGEGEVRLTLAMGRDERRSLTRRISGLIRGEEMPTAEEIDVFYSAVRQGIDDGSLPRERFLPILRFAVAMAAERAGPDGREGHELTAALFGLARACGARGFSLVVGRMAGTPVEADTRDWESGCWAARLGGRIDSRRHFVTAAAIKAASTRRVSFTIGEFKELFDTVSGAGGFDFTDISANASGIRFAETFLRAPPERWTGMLDGLAEDADVLADLDGIPGLMPLAEFRARFGDADSPEYAAMVARIEARVSALPLHAGAAGALR